jgi:hypothetical protein
MTTRTRANADIALRIGVAALALLNGYIHSQLGGLMFTLNAVGFVVLAVALVAPIWPAPQVRWLTRLAVAGYAAATAAGWLLFGARYDTGYISFALDLLILAVVAADSLLVDGSPVTIARKLVRLASKVVPGTRGASGAANA